MGVPGNELKLSEGSWLCQNIQWVKDRALSPPYSPLYQNERDQQHSYVAAPCHPHICWLFSSPGQICFVQHLSSSRGCRIFLAQRKTPSLELQTRRMGRVCLTSMCLVSSGGWSCKCHQDHFSPVPKMSGSCWHMKKRWMGRTWWRESLWMGWCGTVKGLSFKETWDGAARDAPVHRAPGFSLSWLRW